MVQKFYRYWGRCTFLPRSDWSCSAGNLLEPIRCITLTLVVTRRLRSFFKRHFAGESVEGVIYKDRIPEPKIQVKPVCLKSTIALEQMYFQQGWLTLVKLCISPKKDQPRTPGMDFFVQCPGLIFLAARWSGPATSASIFSAFLDYILRVCQSLRDSFFHLGKLHWFLYLLRFHYYNPGMFIFCWSSKKDTVVGFALRCLRLSRCFVNIMMTIWGFWTQRRKRHQRTQHSVI